MVYTTFLQGLKEANESATRATQLEATLQPSIASYQLRVLPALIHSATLYSRLLGSGLVPPEHRGVVVAKWKKVLDRAEKIRTVVEKSGGDLAAAGASAGVLPVVPSRRASDEAEARQIDILRRSSTINSYHVPLWSDTVSRPPSEAFVVDPSREPVVRPQLSIEQASLGAEWVYSNLTASSSSSSSSPLSHRIENQVDSVQPTPDGIRVEQGIGADCSFIAAMSVCLSHNVRWKRNLAMDCLNEVKVVHGGGDDIGETPSAEARYFRVKFFVNGAWRSILVDSALPASTKTDLPMHAVVAKDDDSGITSIESLDGLPTPTCDLSLSTYVPLMEKAYLGLLSPTGYTYRGSTPSLDMQRITGWIPEHVSLSSPEFRRERTWQRLVKGWEAGHVLVCLGTGRQKIGNVARPVTGSLRGRKRSRSRRSAGHAGSSGRSIAEGLGGGLIPLHAYGVVDLWDDVVGSDDGQELRERGLRIVNPWRKAREGQAGPSQTGDAFRMNDIATVLEEEEPEHVFDMSWDEACNRFDSLDVCWDPSSLPHSAVIHDVWKPSAVAHDHASVSSIATPIRLEVETEKDDTEVWLLLSRHLTTTGSAASPESIALHVREIGHGSTNTLSNSSMASETAEGGEYTNGSLILHRYRCRRGKSSILVTPAREGSTAILGFSLTAYCQEPFSMARVHMSLPYDANINSSFRGKTAGGSAKWPTFMHNPQYSLDIRALPTSAAKQAASLRLTAIGPQSIPLNVKIVRARGNRVTDLHPGDIVVDSGPYSHGLAQAQIEDVPVGRYTVVASTFQPGQTCDFSLHLESSLPVRVSDVPQEGAGMYSRTINGAWTEVTSAGRPSSGNYVQNPTMELTVPDPAEVLLRLRLLEPARIPLNVTVFVRGPGGKLGDQVATSGPYSEATSGVSTRAQLAPGIYLVVVSTYSTGICAEFQLSAFGDKAIELQPVPPN